MEERVGDKSPQMFEVGQMVLLRDLRPAATSKWRPAVISRKVGPLAYEVSIDGQTRQAHVDHLKPHPPPESSTQNDLSLTDQAIDNSSVGSKPFLFVDNEQIASEQGSESVTGPYQRPLRHIKPTRRLIEEMP